MPEPSFVLTQKDEKEKKPSVFGEALMKLLRWLLRDVILALFTIIGVALWDAYLHVEYRWPREVATLLACAYSSAWFIAGAPWWVDGASWLNIAIVAASPLGAFTVAGLRVWHTWPQPGEESDDRVDAWHEVVS